MAKRPCLDCGVPAVSTRCSACARAHDRQRWANGKGETYDTEWRKHSRHQRDEWVQANGWVCPGWQRPAHPSHDLVTDHDVGVLCRRCNAVKAATYDKQQAKG